jgi:hypothetical protein
MQPIQVSVPSTPAIIQTEIEMKRDVRKISPPRHRGYDSLCGGGQFNQSLHARQVSRRRLDDVAKDASKQIGRRTVNKVACQRVSMLLRRDFRRTFS